MFERLSTYNTRQLESRKRAEAVDSAEKCPHVGRYMAEGKSSSVHRCMDM